MGSLMHASITIAATVALLCSPRTALGQCEPRWAGGFEASGLGFNSAVASLCLYDDGSGPSLYAGGGFTSSGGNSLAGIARFDGTTWHSVGGGVTAPWGTGVSKLLVFDDGTGEQLYAAGSFSHAGGVPADRIARWNGSTWSALPGGAISGGSVYTMCVHDDGSGSALYVAGDFTHVGGIPRRNVARWNGTAWSAVGTGVDHDPWGSLGAALQVYDDGQGSALYLGGEFTTVSGAPGTKNLARFKNGAWEAVGNPAWNGTHGGVGALGVFDLGDGPKLWLGGWFTLLGGIPALGIGTWDGAQFAPVGSGFPHPGSNSADRVNSFCVFDAGAGLGPRVYAVGAMDSVNGVATEGIAVWNGTTWEGVDGGFDHPVGQGVALYVEQHPAGARLWVGGNFISAGTTASRMIARLDPTCPEPLSFCFGDGSGTACPCGNAGSAGNGCATSFNSAGAHLATTGFTSVSADTVVLTASGLSPAPTTFFQGTQRQAGGAGSVFGDGLRCAGGTTLRIGTMPTIAGASQCPEQGGQPISTRGLVPLAGGTRTYQGWYRNAAAFCTSDTFNLTNGIEIAWAP